MIFILKLYSSSHHDSLEIGDVKINRKKIVSIVYSENYASDTTIKPLQENSEYTYSFLGEGDDYFPYFKIKIISNNKTFYARMNIFKKVLFKSQFSEYWIQKNTWTFFYYLIVFIGVIVAILTYIRQK